MTSGDVKLLQNLLCEVREDVKEIFRKLNELSGQILSTEKDFGFLQQELADCKKEHEEKFEMYRKLNNEQNKSFKESVKDKIVATVLQILLPMAGAGIALFINHLLK